MTKVHCGWPVRLAGSVALTSLIALTTSAGAAVTISTAQSQNMNCANGICAPTATTANLNTTDVANYLAAGNLTVMTTGSGVQANDIVVTGSFNWTSASGLTLDAFHSVTFESAVADNGLGAVSLTTNDGGKNGTLSFIAGGSLSFLSLTNSLSIDGKSYILESGLPAIAAAIAAKPSGRFALSANYDASRDGTYAKSPISTKFEGAFNGLGNAISSLTISSTANAVGLFRYIGSKGSISSLLVTGVNFSVQGSSCAGSVAATNFGTVSNVFADGQVQVLSGRDIALGGLVGCSSGEVRDSAANANLLENRRKGFTRIGGLIGYNGGSIEEAYATGPATVSTYQAWSGGLVGDNTGTIDNCYAEGNASVSSSAASSVGGLVGYSFAPTISHAYSTGSPTASAGSSVGGFIGYDGSGGGLSTDYWDTTTSGITNLSQGAGNIPNDPGITGETTQQLQTGLPAGFDPTIWAENPNINNGLPYFIANPPQ